MRPSRLHRCNGGIRVGALNDRFQEGIAECLIQRRDILLNLRGGLAVKLDGDERLVLVYASVHRFISFCHFRSLSRSGLPHFERNGRVVDAGELIGIRIRIEVRCIVAGEDWGVVAVNHFVGNAFFADVGSAIVIRFGEDVEPVDGMLGVLGALRDAGNEVCALA